MKTLIKATSSGAQMIARAALLVTAIAASAQAQELHDQHVVHDRARGELSVGTGAPTHQTMLNAIDTANASPSRLYSILEYGERVECFQCIPGLQRLLLESGDARVREISAWWLRRRSFGFGRVMVAMKDTLANDANPVRRSRAAEALGEFLDPHGLVALRGAVETDSDATVRAAAVRALGRLNHVDGREVIASAFNDGSVEVRRAAVSVVLHVSFFDDEAGLIGLLGDDDAEVRLHAAQLVGQYRAQDAVAPLAGLLRSDDSVAVRQAAAWALGRIGGNEADAALLDAATTETARGVIDAIEIAQQM